MHKFARILSSFRTVVRKGSPVAIPRVAVGGMCVGAACVAVAPVAIACDSPRPVLVTELPNDLKLKDCRVTLYQFESCPFCRKARAVLDFAKVGYDVVEVNPLTKSETKWFASDYKKVPIVLIEEEGGRSFQIRDSKLIINAILKATGRLNSEGTIRFPSAVKLNEEITLDEQTYAHMSTDEAWIKWTEAYLLQLVVVNIYGTMAESRETFDYLLTHKDFGWVAREASYWAGSLVMNLVARSRLKKYVAIQGRHREAFFAACADLGSATRGEFIGGKNPSAADLNAYGVIRSLEGTRTLKEAIEGGAGEEFKTWYANMNKAVGPSMMKSKVNATSRGNSVKL